MARNQRKQSNRFDDYEESYDDDFEYEVADDDCADDDAEDWSQEEEDGNFDESETTLKYQYRRKSRGGRSATPARSVGGRESRDRRKKTPPPSWVRPSARKPSPSSRSIRDRHDNRREPREPYRDRSLEREQSNHGPHFWDRMRFRKKDRPEDDRSRDQHRGGTGKAARRSDKAYSNAQPANNGYGWRRFLVLLVLLACGTAYTFYATMNVHHQGDQRNASQSEIDPSTPDPSSSTSSHDGEKQQAAERRTSERPETRTRRTGESSPEQTPQDTQNQDTQNSHEPPGLRTQERRTLQEQESDSHVASGLLREFPPMNHTAGTTWMEELPPDGSPGELPLCGMNWRLKGGCRHP